MKKQEQHAETNIIQMEIRSIMLLLSTFVLCLMHTVGLSQSIPEQMLSYVGQLHESKSISVPAVFKEVRNSKTVIDEASKYFTDTLSYVRTRMYDLVGSSGKRSIDLSTRQLATGKLCSVTSDYENLDVIISQLGNFITNDFSTTSRDSLASLFRRSPPYQGELIRLIGSLQLTELTNDLKVVVGNSAIKQGVRWAALIALARMGDQESIQSMMKRVQRLPVNDDVVYEVFPDLVYTRQKQAIDYLIVELKSDEKKCYTADAEDETPITCAYRIMEMLAPVIDKYPLQIDASGDIQTKDYKKSLTTVRAWFEKNKSYQLIQ